MILAVLPPENPCGAMTSLAVAEFFQSFPREPLKTAISSS
jgi:hypothetical protein